MTGSLGFAAGIVCTVAIAVAAQTTPPSSQTPSSSADKVTVTGCIERSSASPSSTPGTTGTSGTTSSPSSSSSSSKFILNTSPAGSGAAGTSGTTSTSSTPSASASASAKSYQLDADDSQLTPHVGHKVEITGTVEGGSSSSRTSTSSTGATASSSVSQPKLKVDSVRMIASSCSQ